MKIQFTERAWTDYTHWQQADRKLLKRVNELIRDVKRAPFDGIGKPEPLKFSLAGCWSRRIDDKHRLVYRVEKDVLVIIQCRFHY